VPFDQTEVNPQVHFPVGSKLTSKILLANSHLRGQRSPREAAYPRIASFVFARTPHSRRPIRLSPSNSSLPVRSRVWRGCADFAPSRRPAMPAASATCCTNDECSTGLLWIYDVYRRAGGRAWDTRRRPVQDAGWQADPSGQDITDGPHLSLYLRPDGTIIGSESTASTPSQHR